jgi:hypothetical protein
MTPPSGRGFDSKPEIKPALRRLTQVSPHGIDRHVPHRGSDFHFGETRQNPGGDEIMSFKIVEQAPARLNRSELAVPGSNTSLFEKAAKSEADVIFLDLEDAVAPDDKPQARRNVIEALNDIDWGNKTLSLRINGLDTHYIAMWSMCWSRPANGST